MYESSIIQQFGVFSVIVTLEVILVLLNVIMCFRTVANLIL